MVNDFKFGGEKMEERYCQCCAMPMGAANEMYGTNTDGSKNEDYCKYCFTNGEFTSNATMDEMIEFCVPHMTAAHPEIGEADAREMMRKFFPALKRWKQD